MIANGHILTKAQPIKNMLLTKEKGHGVSHGLSEAGYDIRIKQSVHFMDGGGIRHLAVHCAGSEPVFEDGRFAIASTVEEFDMPNDLVGVVHDKSTWARRGLSVFNTVIEPGWKGFLTLELVYHGEGTLVVPAGAGIAQVLFHVLTCPAEYAGKYQHQEDRPVESRDS